MRGVTAIKNAANIFLNDEEIEKKLKTWNKDFVTSMIRGMSKNSTNQTTSEISQIITQHLDNNKELFIEILDGEQNFDELRADVFKDIPDSITKVWERNEKRLEPKYNGSVYRTVEQNKDDLYKKNDDGSFEIDEFDGSKVIDELAKTKIQPSIDSLPDYQREATEKYILENTNLEKYKREDNPQAVEQIDILISDGQDPRQELDYFYTKDLLSPQTYSKRMNEYNNITGPDLKKRKLQNKIRENEGTIKDLQVSEAISNLEIAKIINGWTDILSENPEIYANNPEQHDKDFAEYLRSSGRSVASVWKTTGSPMPEQSTVSKSALVDGDNVALNEVLVNTLVYAQNTWPNDIEKQKDYLQEQAGLINEAKNVWEVNHIDPETRKPTPFVWLDINKGVLDKMEQGIEIEKVDPDKREPSSTKRKEEFNNFSYDNIYKKIEELTTLINENPSYITDEDAEGALDVRKVINRNAKSLFEIIEKEKKRKDVGNLLSEQDIRNILNQSIFLEREDIGLGDFYPTKVVKSFDPKFNHVSFINNWKQKLIQAGERANTNE